MKTEQLQALLKKASVGCWQIIDDDLTIASGSFKKIGKAENSVDAYLMSLAPYLAAEVFNLRDERDLLLGDTGRLTTQVSDLKAELQLLKQSKLAAEFNKLDVRNLELQSQIWDVLFNIEQNPNYTLVDAANSLLVVLPQENYMMPRHQRWIPVGERLPKYDPNDNWEYLVYDTLNNKVNHDYWICPADGSQPFWNHYGQHVTHWMPLPEAPLLEQLP